MLVILSRKSVEFLLFAGDSFNRILQDKNIDSLSNPTQKEKIRVCIYGAGSLGNLTLEFLYKFKKNVIIECFFLMIIKI